MSAISDDGGESCACRDGDHIERRKDAREGILLPVTRIKA